ncbi:MAG: hypothetical protein ACJAWZ_003983 [Paracoccaceae bacterium]|jgi:hypothetical protein
MQTPRGAVLHASRMNHGADHQAQRVGHDMPLAAFDPFPGAEAPRAAAFSGFHALAVDNARRGAGSGPSSSRAAMTIRWLMARSRPPFRQS